MSTYLSHTRRLLLLHRILEQSRPLTKPTKKVTYSTLTYHSEPQRFTIPEMAHIRLVPALDDNYMYLLVDEATRECAAVDPVEPQKILSAVKEEDVKLTKILTTHHHWDHAGGNEEMAKLVPGLQVSGNDDRIGALNNRVSHGDKIKFGSFDITCLYTPCHTSGHICYYVEGDKLQSPIVFTGDTLFVGGCGKFFEGNPQQMYTALVEILGPLPSNTRVFCGHEYTIGNLKYAQHVEPNNQCLADKLKWAQAQRAAGKPTIPSTIGEELQFNPFMRVKEDPVKKHASQTDPVEVMKFLREEKNSFKPKS